MTVSKEDTKIKIFISYGHEDSAITNVIDSYLREKGYEVWYDVSSIRGTDDWREEIIEGIHGSQTVLANLSEDFLEEGGVCSEEMGIALAVKSNRIFTIYLEKKVKLDNIPPTLTRTQYVDLSDWKKYIGDEEKFNKWFKKAFQPIIDRIEDKENVKFSGQINTIRQALRIAEIGSNKANSYLIKKYTKRPWIDAKLESWMDDPRGKKIGVIYGKQGTGKSNYAARRCHTDYRIVANFFCEYNKENFSSNKILIRDLSFQLACQIADFRFALIKQLRSISIVKKKINDMGFEEIVEDGKIYISEDYSEEEEFDNLIIKPLSMCMDGKMESKLILIDALDEAGKEDRSRLINIIINHQDRLPRWIRILVLTRPEADIKPYLQGAFEIDLDKEKNEKDIKIFLENTFENHPYKNKDQIIEKIVEKSEGTFLYADLVAKEILENTMDIENIDKLPDGLASYFLNWFSRIYPIEKIDSLYKDKDRKAIAIILASPGALPREELRNLLGWDHSQTNDFVKKLENYLTINEDEEGTETIEFAHKYMVDWLLSDLAGDYRVFKEDGLSYIYKGIEELYLMDKELDSMTRYEKLNLIDALKNQRGQKALKDFLENDAAKKAIIDFAIKESESCRIISATKLYEDMLEIFKRDEKNLSYYLITINCYNNLLSDTGREDYAIENLEKALMYAQNITIENDNNIINNYIASSYSNLGLLYKLKNMYKEAEKNCKKAIELLEKSNPSTNLPRKDGILASSYNNLANLYDSENRYEESEIFYKKSIIILEKLNVESDSSIIKANLASSYNNLGHLYQLEKKYKEVEAFYKKAIKLLETLNSDEKTFESIVNLSSTYNNLGFLYILMNKYEESDYYCKKSIDLLKTLQLEKNSFRAMSILASSYCKLGNICEERHKYTDSEMFYKKAIDIQEDVIAVRNLSMERENLSFYYGSLGNLFISTDRYDEAEKYYKKAIEILEEFKFDKNNIHIAGFLATYYNKLGNVYGLKKRNEESEKYHKKAINIGEKIHKVKFDYVNIKRILSSYISITMIYYGTNQVSQWRKNALMALRYHKLILDKERSKDNLADLATTYIIIANSYADSKGNKVEKYYLKAKTIFEDLYNNGFDRDISSTLAYLYKNLSVYYKRKGKHKKAENYTKKLGELTGLRSRPPGAFNVFQINNLDDFI